MFVQIFEEPSVAGAHVHNFDGARTEVLLSLRPFSDMEGNTHIAVRYHVAVFTLASLRNPDGWGGGRVSVECGAGCVGYATWEFGDLTYLGLLQRAWSDVHGLTVHAGANFANHGQE